MDLPIHCDWTCIQTVVVATFLALSVTIFAARKTKKHPQIQPTRTKKSSSASHGPERKGNDQRKNDENAPSSARCPFSGAPISDSSSSMRCPFSGVAFDEAAFKQFLKDQQRDDDDANEEEEASTRAVRGCPMSGNNAAKSSSGDQPEHLSTSPDAGGSVLDILAAQKNTSTMRVRISNETSLRSKDVVVDVRSNVFVHESVYNHAGVKSAGVRRWTPEIARGVQNHTHAIRCVVLLDWRPEGASREVVYDLNDLKKLSTKDLFDLAPSSDPVRLVLRCVDTKP